MSLKKQERSYSVLYTNQNQTLEKETFIRFLLSLIEILYKYDLLNYNMPQVFAETEPYFIKQTDQFNLRISI